ncbi:hypothetical protein [Mesorhizobium sp. M0060]|uniref:hypothetical protein n=1 Tax=Mesorhizobium sp. M0060 TaxID=2956866 RepID=UPI0033389A4E
MAIARMASNDPAVHRWTATEDEGEGSAMPFVRTVVLGTETCPETNRFLILAQCSPAMLIGQTFQNSSWQVLLPTSSLTIKTVPSGRAGHRLPIVG